jgi:hypothetical protein
LRAKRGALQPWVSTRAVPVLADAFAYAYADKVVAEPLGTMKRVMIPPSPFATRAATRLQMAIELGYIDVSKVPAMLLQNVAEVDGCTNVAHCGRITVSV